MQIESYRESIRQGLKKYSNRGMRTAYAYGYLNSACSSAQYTREEIQELANIMDFEYRESIRQSLKKYSNRGMRTAYAYGYLNSACSSAQYTREEIQELANIIDFELNVA